MRNLIEFLVKYSSAFLFTFLCVISLVLLFSNGRYLPSIWFSSANGISSSVYGVSRGITGYFYLKEINEQLQQNNARLENEVLNLKNQIAEYRSVLSDSADFVPTEKRYGYVLATIINNSTQHARNYFTINKGSQDGIKAGMGVVNQNGVIGIVDVVGKKTSRVMSILNTNQHISARIKGTETVGSVVWKGSDPTIAYLEEVPKHAVTHIGDTVVSSGFSTSFPAELPIGVVMGKVRTVNENYYTLKVRLAGDIKKLSTVRVLTDNLKEEIDSIRGLSE
ncbi:MAG: rod shape-determining protein MreC [Muribaculaceae bacterium]|nr:rod shape-determining protein MreC [Muribaculaceae bacterium]